MEHRAEGFEQFRSKLSDDAKKARRNYMVLSTTIILVGLFAEPASEISVLGVKFKEGAGIHVIAALIGLYLAVHFELLVKRDIAIHRAQWDITFGHSDAHDYHGQDKKFARLIALLGTLERYLPHALGTTSLVFLLVRSGAIAWLFDRFSIVQT